MTISTKWLNRLLVAAAIMLFVLAAFLIASPKAQAIPPQPGVCVSGGWGYAVYEDCDLWPDGSFWHREVAGFIGFGGRSGRVCDGMPPPFTDNDPTTPCPGVVMP